jgi:hypothetical protein
MIYRTPGLDPLIEPYVLLLNANDITTSSSCQGHPGENYETGFPKPERACVSGELHDLSDLLKITELVAGDRCLCGTCRDFHIEAGVRADAGGIFEPTQYWFNLEFNTHMTHERLKLAAKNNKKLREVVKALAAH